MRTTTRRLLSLLKMSVVWSALTAGSAAQGVRLPAIPSADPPPQIEALALVRIAAEPGWTHYTAVLAVRQETWWSFRQLDRAASGLWRVKTREGYQYDALGHQLTPVGQQGSSGLLGGPWIPPAVSVATTLSFRTATGATPIELVLQSRDTRAPSVLMSVPLSDARYHVDVEAALVEARARGDLVVGQLRLTKPLPGRARLSSDVVLDVAPLPSAPLPYRANALPVKVTLRNLNAGYGATTALGCFVLDDFGRVWRQRQPGGQLLGASNLGPNQSLPLMLTFVTDVPAPAPSELRMTCRGTDAVFNLLTRTPDADRRAQVLTAARAVSQPEEAYRMLSQGLREFPADDAIRNELVRAQSKLTTGASSPVVPPRPIGCRDTASQVQSVLAESLRLSYRITSAGKVVDVWSNGGAATEEFIDAAISETAACVYEPARDPNGAAVEVTGDKTYRRSISRR